ncbi:hypothetical protein ABPG75_008842 [Micractinium tetrahymenae]
MTTPSPPASSPPAAALPPLYHALLSGDPSAAAALLEDGAEPLEQLPGGVTTLHAAALGGCSAAVLLLAARGVPLDAGLARPPAALHAFPGLYPPVVSPDGKVQWSKDLLQMGSTPLGTACWLGQPHVAAALLAAGAACDIAVPSSEGFTPRDFEDPASPFHWLMGASLSVSEARNAAQEANYQAVAAAAAALLAHLTRQLRAGSLVPSPDQLASVLQLAALYPTGRDSLRSLLALPGIGGQLDEPRRRRVQRFVVDHLGDPAAIGLLQASPLRCEPLDPGSKLLLKAAEQRSQDTPAMVRALLQHGSRTTLEAVNTCISNRVCADTLEALLEARLPAPVPCSHLDPSTFWDGEYGSPSAFYNVTCPFYSLMRRDCFLISKTPQDTRVRMCQALLDAGYRPTVYKSIVLQVLDRKGEAYTPRALHDFNILTDWGRKGRTKGGRAAARTLPLAHHREGSAVKGSNGGAGGDAGAAAIPPNLLSAVPLEFVLGAIKLAAFPLEPWLATDPSTSSWRALEFYREFRGLLF